MKNTEGNIPSRFYLFEVENKAVVGKLLNSNQSTQ